MKKVTRWANIMCNQKMEPFKMIVTDGFMTTELPIKNSRLSMVRRTARDVYGVRSGNILVTQIFDNKHE